MTVAATPSARPRGMARDAMVATIQDLVDLAPRATGTPGGEAAAAYVVERFRGAGLPEVSVEETRSYAWEASEHRLEVGGAVLEALPIRH